MSFASMPLFTGDYLRDTRHLTPLRHGIYLLALMHCWDSKGPMPLDEQEASGICNCRSADEIDALRYIMDRFFVRMDDGHYNKRMADEVANAERWSQKSREGGLKSAITRRDKARKGTSVKRNKPPLNHRSTVLERSLVSPSPSPSPSLTPSPTDSGEVSPGPSQAPSTVPASGVPSRKRASKPAGESKSAATWARYSEAYNARYGAKPVRNAKVNGQLAQLVGRLGADEAPAVAAFYVQTRTNLYVAAKHCTDLLLRDAEKLRTEWATGNVTYQRDARESDRLGSTGAMWKEVAEHLNAKGIK